MKAERLLGHARPFAGLPAELLAKLAQAMREEHFDAGQVVVREGDLGDRLFVILSGHAEVAVAGRKGPTPVALLHPGEAFGELALVDPSRSRVATVTALSSLRLLSLGDGDFQELLREHPEIRLGLEQSAEDTAEAHFLKKCTPFSRLDGDTLRRLSQRVVTVRVSAGTVVVQQGETGESCYFVRSGRLEVVSDQEERVLGTVTRGMLFGEVALLTKAPRNATVRVVEEAELLVLSYADLLEAIGANLEIGRQMVELVVVRRRPRRRQGVEAHHRQTCDGQTVTILKDPERGSYYQVSPEGWFLWQRLDGAHSVRDLTMDYLATFHALGLEAIVRVLGGLAAGGFLEGPWLTPDVRKAVEHRGALGRMVALGRRLLDWKISLRNVDAPLQRVYKATRLLFRGPILMLLAAVAIAGVLTFAWEWSRMAEAVGHYHRWLWLLPLLLYLSLFLHEMGHALTVKAFGREVPRVGVGWYWFCPVAFVDTSDMWLAARWPRVAVSAAGPATNLLLGSLAALALPFVSNPEVLAVLGQYILVSYFLVLFNLNPLLEFDGYYMLMDWLERPNLRQRALAWLGKVRRPGDVAGHGLEFAFALACLAYVLLEGALTLVLYRTWVQEWLAIYRPDLAAPLGWIVASTVVLLTAAMLVGEMKSIARK